jgi:hypothetical protein
MGFLDTTSRWMDVMLTAAGKRALAEGDLDVQFYSFGDRSSAYLVEGQIGERAWFVEPDKHLMIEAFSRPQDLVTLTVDDYGDIVRDENLLLVNDEGEIQSPPAFSGERSKQRVTKDLLQRFSTNWSTALKSFASISPIESEGEFEIKVKDGNRDNAKIPRRLWDVDAVQRITQHLPMTEDEEFASLTQMRFLPPVVIEGEVRRPLGNWNPVFPEPVVVNKDVLQAAYRDDRECMRVNLSEATGSFQFFLVDEDNDVVLPLTIVRSETDDAALKSWVVGELIDADNETHFFRLFRVFFSEGPVVEDPRTRLLHE